MTLPLAAGTYRLDRHHSQVGFTITHLGLTPVRGLFPEFDGALHVGEGLGDSHLEVSVGLPSVQSGHTGRDERLQAADYFDTAACPTMAFRSTAISAVGEGWLVVGDLTARGVTVALHLDVAMTGRRVSPLDGQEHVGFVASGRLSRTAFGIALDVPPDVLGDEVEVDLAAQLIAD